MRYTVLRLFLASDGHVWTFSTSVLTVYMFGRKMRTIERLVGSAWRRISSVYDRVVRCSRVVQAWRGIRILGGSRAVDGTVHFTMFFG